MPLGFSWHSALSRYYELDLRGLIGDQGTNLASSDRFDDVTILAEVENHQWHVVFHAV